MKIETDNLIEKTNNILNKPNTDSSNNSESVTVLLSIINDCLDLEIKEDEFIF